MAIVPVEVADGSGDAVDGAEQREGSAELLAYMTNQRAANGQFSTLLLIAATSSLSFLQEIFTTAWILHEGAVDAPGVSVMPRQG